MRRRGQARTVGEGGDRTATELVEKGIDPELAMDISDFDAAMRQEPTIPVDLEAQYLWAARRSALRAAMAADFALWGFPSLVEDAAESACEFAAYAEQIREPKP